jgi:hypothetical protein
VQPTRGLGVIFIAKIAKLATTLSRDAAALSAYQWLCAGQQLAKARLRDCDFGPLRLPARRHQHHSAGMVSLSAIVGRRRESARPVQQVSQKLWRFRLSRCVATGYLRRYVSVGGGRCRCHFLIIVRLAAERLRSCKSQPPTGCLWRLKARNAGSARATL